MIAVALAVWLSLSAFAVLAMIGICRAGRMEDEARGYTPFIPAPRGAEHDRTPAPVGV